MIVHLRVIPGFWIAVEESRRPELHSHPVVLGGLPHQRGHVREMNGLAQRAGVRAGMTLAQAYQQCPEAIFLIPDGPRYEAVWNDVCAALATFTPLVEPLEMGQAVCDLTGCERQWESPWEMAHAIGSAVRHCGINPCLGIASNRITAELASTAVTNDGCAIIAAGGERAFLAQLPLALLPGLDPGMALTCQVLGLKTIGQFADLPAPAVRQRFGAVGERLHSYARGIDPRPVTPPPSRRAVSVHRECDEGSLEEATEIVRRLADLCAAELQRDHLAGKLITLALDWEELPVRKGRRVGPRSATEQWPTGPECEAAGSIPISCQERPVGHCFAGPPYNLAASPPGRVRASPCGCPPTALPVAYRIHSMLPQPGNRSTHAPVEGTELQELQGPPPAELFPQPSSSSCTRVSTLLRIPIDSASPLIERAQRLLMQNWRQERGARSPLHAITLEVSEFQAPTQLSFAELNRIDGSGLRGMDASRLQSLLQQEEVLASRYGDASFRHVTHVDPASVLTERRFRWCHGLSPAYTPVARPLRKRR